MKNMFFNFISPVSQLLASLSIVAAACMFIYDSIQDRATDLSATIVSSSNKEVTLFLTNIGGRDVVLKRAFLYVPMIEQRNPISLGKIQKDLLVKTGETLILESFESDLKSSVLLESVDTSSYAKVGDTECILEIEYMNVYGDNYESKFEHKCFAGSVGAF